MLLKIATKIFKMAAKCTKWPSITVNFGQILLLRSYFGPIINLFFIQYYIWTIHTLKCYNKTTAIFWNDNKQFSKWLPNVQNGRHIQPITGLMSVLWLCLWSKYQLIFIDYYILTIFELQFEVKQLKKFKMADNSIQNGRQMLKMATIFTIFWINLTTKAVFWTSYKSIFILYYIWTIFLTKSLKLTIQCY